MHARCRDLVDCVKGTTRPPGCDISEKCLYCTLKAAIREGLVEGRRCLNRDAEALFDFNGTQNRVYLHISTEPLVIRGRRHVVVTLQDITEHRLLGMKLQSNLDLLNSISEAAMIGGWELDADSMEGTWTEEMYRIYELPLGQKPHINEAIRTFYHPDDRLRIAEAIRRAIQLMDPYDLELRFITARNRFKWVRAIGKPIVGKGKTKRLVGVFQDITDRKAAEEQRDQLEEQLQQAMKMEAVGRLAGGVAHDFNNLLTGIAGYTNMLLSRLNPDDPMAADLREIQNATQSAVGLARQLLVFSRKQLIEPRVLNLNDLVLRLRKMLVHLVGEDTELETHLCEDLGCAKVDPGQFEQILVNLVVNSRDAMPEGGKLVIETANRRVDEVQSDARLDMQPGSYVTLTVSDTGCGMSKETRSHLFEPFFTTKPKGRGTGLGLATIYGAVKQSGGSIEVSSEVGMGSSFKISLPRVQGIPDQPKKENIFTSDMPGGDETILLVEDEHIVRELAIKVLSRLGYNVLHAPDGRQALTVAQEYHNPIHMLLTDVVMPGMNGRQLADKLIAIHPEMKILYTSGYTEDAVAEHGVIEENLNFLGKPYSPQSLARKIRELLD